MYYGIMTHNMKVTLDTDIVADHIDQFAAQLDALGFPTTEIDLEANTVIVDASTDYDEYSVLMAFIEAAENVGVESDDLDIMI